MSPDLQGPYSSIISPSVPIFCTPMSPVPPVSPHFYPCHCSLSPPCPKSPPTPVLPVCPVLLYPGSPDPPASIPVPHTSVPTVPIPSAPCRAVVGDSAGRCHQSHDPKPPHAGRLSRAAQAPVGTGRTVKPQHWGQQRHHRSPGTSPWSHPTLLCLSFPPALPHILQRDGFPRGILTLQPGKRAGVKLPVVPTVSRGDLQPPLQPQTWNQGFVSLGWVPTSIQSRTVPHRDPQSPAWG